MPEGRHHEPRPADGQSASVSTIVRQRLTDSEVIMRKPELFKCLFCGYPALVQRACERAFYAGFGNRITDAMSYRSVGIDASKIYTIDSNGVVKTELLQSAGHKGSYFALVSFSCPGRANFRTRWSMRSSRRSRPNSSLSSLTSTTGASDPRHSFAGSISALACSVCAI